MNKRLRSIIGIGVVLGLIVAGFIYFKYFTNNTNLNEKEVFIKIPSGSNYEEVKKIVSPYIKDYASFEFIANLRKYPDNIKSGRFLIKKGMGSFALVTSLRQNIPVKLAFNNQERLENFVQRVSSQIEPDSLQLITVLKDSTFLAKNGFKPNTVLGMFLPNSYEVYWNISAEKFRDKMLKEYHSFWNKERLLKAEKLNLTPVQVIILASIVHKESVKKDERPTIAGVYLNRLNVGMPLQADPTVIYALKTRDNNFDQVIKRVLYNDLLINSPYNTYINIGLPPGPIAMPDITAIDAVLNPVKHNYIYFCASVEKFGYHEFASTYSQHQVNAARYSSWLNNQGTNR